MKQRGVISHKRTALATALTLGGVLLSTTAMAAACPQITAKNGNGIDSAYPLQFELAELQKKANCQLSFSQNPAIADLNKRIEGNKALAAVADRLPSEPLVVAPYDMIGTYGGTLKGLSKGTESGTSDLLSVRHVNFLRYHNDLQTVVPNIAKTWSWNPDFTELTIELRKGHKWSDGSAFTSADVKFWYEDLILNKEIFAKTPGRWLFDGKPMKVETPSETLVKMTFPVPAPGILNRFAVDYGQPFQPMAFLQQFHIKYNPKADEMAKAKGFKGWGDMMKVYYGGSDWKDVPTPLLAKKDKMVTPTLESHIVVEETATGRRMVANPYFHMVDTAGNQLPYINEIQEDYVKDKEVQTLKITNGEVTYKSQAVFIEDFSVIKENEGKGKYKVELAPDLGTNVYYGFNVTHKDAKLREIFADIKFRQAMSVAINRDEINEVVLLGQGTPLQATPAEPGTVAFLTDTHTTSFADYNPDMAKKLLADAGLKDSDGDGFVERKDGKPLVVKLTYASQGGPVRQHELVRDYWNAVGVRVDLKEVTSDEYRAAGNNNDLDVTTWKNDGITGAAISQDATPLFPPFGDYFNPGNGFEWAAWKTSEGKEGTEPPASVKKLWDLAAQFAQAELGTDKSNMIGKEIADLHVNNLWKIGTVGSVRQPYVHADELKNCSPYKAKAYDYYWAYPYRPQQWFIQK